MPGIMSTTAGAPRRRASGRDRNPVTVEASRLASTLSICSSVSDIIVMCEARPTSAAGRMKRRLADIATAPDIDTTAAATIDRIAVTTCGLVFGTSTSIWLSPIACPHTMPSAMPETMPARVMNTPTTRPAAVSGKFVSAS